MVSDTCQTQSEACPRFIYYNKKLKEEKLSKCQEKIFKPTKPPLNCLQLGFEVYCFDEQPHVNDK